MNELFVNVKVDREERPDVDALYMQATLSLAGQGGWPMTVFLTPDGRPFYAGTYFPKTARGGLPAFPDLCRAIAGAYRNRREDVEGQAAEVARRLALASARRALDRGARPAGARRRGGGAGAHLRPGRGRLRRGAQVPALPGAGVPAAPPLAPAGRPQRARDGGADARTRWPTGGIHDQIGGGFHRYSVDGHWLVPHFEKMLYDNALLARDYALAHRLTGGAGHARVAEATLDYLLREMRVPGGAPRRGPGRGLAGRRGRLLRLDARRAGAPAAARAGAGRRPALRRHPGGQLRGRLDPPRRRAAGRRVARAGPGRRPAARRGPRDALRRPRRAPGAGPGRQGGDRLERARDRGARRGRRDPGPRRLRRRRRGGGVLRAGPAGRRRAAAPRPHRRGRRAPGAARRPRGPLPRPAVPLRRHLRAALARRGPRRSRTGWSRSSPTPSGAASSTRAPTARPWWPAPASSRTTRRRPATRRRPTCCCAWPTSPATPPSRSSPWARCGWCGADMPRFPQAFGTALIALDHHLAERREIAVVGPPDDPRTAALIRAARAGAGPFDAIAAGDPADPSAAAAAPLLAERPLVGGAPAAYVCRNFTCLAPVTEPDALRGRPGRRVAGPIRCGRRGRWSRARRCGRGRPPRCRR